MISLSKWTVVLGMSVAMIGCHSDRPHDYGQMRPPVGDIDRRDRGLQSADVVEASDRVVMEILALPDFNQPTRQTIVVTDVVNDTTNPTFNYDIFIRRLSTNIAKYGRDRIMLLDRKDRIARARASEIEGVEDPFGQGDGRTTVPPTSVQPEWELWGRFTNLPNRGTDYYFAEFVLTNLKTRETIPIAFETRVGR